MIAIIDYGMGNVRSVEKAFVSLGYPAVITSDSDEIDRASHIVLPGVGAFGDAVRELQQRRLINLAKQVIESGRPFLGICLGLQILFERSCGTGDYSGRGGSISNATEGPAHGMESGSRLSS
jgi:glutamine amidotransferase